MMGAWTGVAVRAGVSRGARRSAKSDLLATLAVPAAIKDAEVEGKIGELMVREEEGPRVDTITTGRRGGGQRRLFRIRWIARPRRPLLLIVSAFGIWFSGSRKPAARDVGRSLSPVSGYAPSFPADCVRVAEFPRAKTRRSDEERSRKPPEPIGGITLTRHLKIPHAGLPRSSIYPALTPEVLHSCTRCSEWDAR